MTKIVIVAGGLATRMRPITEEIPKCMVDVNSKPLIQHQLEFFRSKGYTEIIFCVAHLAEKVKEHFKDGSWLGMRIGYVQETGGLMGTAGSVKLVEDRIGADEHFIVYYGDNLTSMDLDSLLKFHRQHGGVGTIAMRPNPPGYKGSSLITLDKQSRIRLFLEKPPAEELARHEHEQKFINNGIYAFSKRIFGYIPAGEKYDFAKQVFPALVQENGLYGYPTREFFFEVGRVEKYEQLKEMVKGKENIFS